MGIHIADTGPILGMMHALQRGCAAVRAELDAAEMYMDTLVREMQMRRDSFAAKMDAARMRMERARERIVREEDAYHRCCSRHSDDRDRSDACSLEYSRYRSALAEYEACKAEYERYKKIVDLCNERIESAESRRNDYRCATRAMVMQLVTEKCEAAKSDLGSVLAWADEVMSVPILYVPNTKVAAFTHGIERVKKKAEERAARMAAVAGGDDGVNQRGDRAIWLERGVEVKPQEPAAESSGARASNDPYGPASNPSPRISIHELLGKGRGR